MKTRTHFSHRCAALLVFTVGASAACTSEPSSESSSNGEGLRGTDATSGSVPPGGGEEPVTERPDGSGGDSSSESDTSSGDVGSSGGTSGDGGTSSSSGGYGEPGDSAVPLHLTVGATVGAESSVQLSPYLIGPRYRSLYGENVRNACPAGNEEHRFRFIPHQYVVLHNPNPTPATIDLELLGAHRMVVAIYSSLPPAPEMSGDHLHACEGAYDFGSCPPLASGDPARACLTGAAGPILPANGSVIAYFGNFAPGDHWIGVNARVRATVRAL